MKINLFITSTLLILFSFVSQAASYSCEISGTEANEFLCEEMDSNRADDPAYSSHHAIFDSSLNYSKTNTSKTGICYVGYGPCFIPWLDHISLSQCRKKGGRSWSEDYDNRCVFFGDNAR